MHDRLSPTGIFQYHVTYLNFRKSVIISRKRCKVETQLQWKTNRKSYVAYTMAPLPVTFSDLEGHFCCLKLFYFTYHGKQCMHYIRYVYT